MRAVRRTRCAAAVGAATVAVALVAGCASSGGSGAPTWVPSPGFGSNGEGPNVQVTPIIPVPSLAAPAQPGGRPRGSGTPAPSASASGADPFVVAKHLRAPVGLTMLPDNTALVGERTTGRIVRVQPRAGQPVRTVRTLTGLDATGDGGLLDLALSPDYSQDGLIYAYITTARDNRVVDFTLRGAVAAVVTGIPKGRTGNPGRIAFGADGDLYIGTGDAGHPTLAAVPTSLAGKVLRVNDIGAAAPGNPQRSSVWASGLHGAAGLCVVPGTATVFEAETGDQGAEINLLAGGDFYGWPSSSGQVQEPAAAPPTGYGAPGGCTVQDGVLWSTSLDGKALLAARLSGTGASIKVGRFTADLKGKYGRLRTVVAASDGALWLTTANRDGHGTPVPDDERVIRYLPPSGGGTPNPA